MRPLEHTVSERVDDEAQLVQGYCAAVPGALCDEGHAPLVPGGLRLHERLEQIDASLERVAQKTEPAETAPTLTRHPQPCLGGDGSVLATLGGDVSLRAGSR
ncbi:hypothetical protein [Halochromatium glycolicum]|uniref:Uncharacterized protein n=1 Tax=Halochromatium glycolicum TaxID=85075 RepID=A0AAJ0U0L0_9GAMM|nr:hypothetical protein [Halochromatium glycolicum]MBK1703184.1 hypothetical protein [Halochromatium glycolicum]